MKAYLHAKDGTRTEVTVLDPPNEPRLGQLDGKFYVLDTETPNGPGFVSDEWVGDPPADVDFLTYHEQALVAL